jgi:Ni/Co efflux regulator RcnB
MKTRLITTVVAIAALSAGGALAQSDHKGDEHKGGQQSGQQAGGHQQGGGAQQGAHQQGAHQQGGAAQSIGSLLKGPSGGGQTGGTPGRAATTRQTHTYGGQTGGYQTGGYQNRGGQTRGDRTGGRESGGVQAYRGGGGNQFVYRGQRHDQIRGSNYNYPSGYGYRRWGIGQNLPLLFLTEAYFFNDYAGYGFGAPPYGYVWVRYGPDLLLVSRRTGRVSQVIYGAFY